MSFTSLIFKNLARSRVRTALTVLGISIGITAMVALGVIVGGMKDTAGALTRAYGADFFVAMTSISLGGPPRNVAPQHTHEGTLRDAGSRLLPRIGTLRRRPAGQNSSGGWLAGPI